MLFFLRDPDPDVRTRADAFVGDLRLVGTSSYARLEFKRSWMLDLVYLHSLLRRYGEIGKTLLHINRKLTADVRTQRKLRRTLDHVARFVGSAEQSPDGIDVDVVLAHIENAIQSEWTRFELLDFIVDGTSCVRAREAPVVKTDGSIDVAVSRCRRDRIHCQVHRHYEKNREAFGRLRANLREIQEPGTVQLKRFLEVLDRAEDDPESLCDDSVCRKIGDPLIASDCLSGEPKPSLVSSNRAEYDLVCDALGVDFLPFA